MVSPIEAAHMVIAAAALEGWKRIGPEQVMAVVIVGAAVIIALFVLLGLVRWWAYKASKKPSAAGGLDMDQLRGQLESGEILPEEYEAIRSGLVGRPVLRPADKGEADQTPSGQDGGQGPIIGRTDESAEQEGPRAEPDEDPDRQEGSQDDGPR